MECREIGSLLHSYADGELDPRESAAVESHLKICTLCRSRVATLRAWHDAIRNAAKSAPPPLSLDFSERLQRRLDETAERMDRESSLIGMRLKKNWQWWASAAAIAVCTIGIAAFWGTSTSQQRSDDTERTFILYAKDSINRHRHQLPVEVSAGSQPQKVGKWFRGKVDFNPGVPPSLNRKASLVGARLSNVRDRQAAYFVYDLPKSDDGRASVFAFDAPDLEVPKGRKVDDCDVMLTNQQGYNVVIWKNDEVAYSLVADLDEQDILEMVSCDGKDDVKKSKAVAADQAEAQAEDGADDAK